MLPDATDSIQFDEKHSRTGTQRRSQSAIQQRLVRLQKMGSPTGKQAMAKRRTRAQGRERLAVMLLACVSVRQTALLTAKSSFFAVLNSLHVRLNDLAARCDKLQAKHAPCGSNPGTLGNTQAYTR